MVSLRTRLVFAYIIRSIIQLDMINKLNHFILKKYNFIDSGTLRAYIVKTNKFIIIGIFNAQLKMLNGVNQNPGELNKRV